MTRRVTLLAACVDAAFLCFFLLVDSPLLAWLNVVSIAMYAVAYRLLSRRRNRPAVILIWIEVLGHALIGTLLTGWDAGFNYYLLMFIPAIMVSGGWRTVTPPLVLLFVSYVGLHEMSRVYGALAPLSGAALSVLYVFNVSIFFAMASYTARFYYAMVLKTEGKLRNLAIKDTLTGLSNRRHLMDLAQQEIERLASGDGELALVIADIDDFKQINDGWGHDAGDQVLIHGGAVFQNCCRAHDTVARWGGEEFLFLLPDSDAAAAVEFAERVRSAIGAMRIEHAGQQITCSISLGVATLGPSESLEDAIGRADRALYQSKTEGRDRVTVAVPVAHDVPVDGEDDVLVAGPGVDLSVVDRRGNDRRRA
ncbi:GGDEF domain-containing protein [Salinisphaera aquimarina]